MEETHDDPEQGERVPSSSTWWTSNLAENFGSISLSTGILSDPVTNGVYSVTPDRRLKQMFHRLPTLEELSQLEAEGFRADVIVVDSQKDHKLLRLKQLITTLLIGLHSNPSAIIKKIAGVRCIINLLRGILSMAKHVFSRMLLDLNLSYFGSFEAEIVGVARVPSRFVLVNEYKVSDCYKQLNLEETLGRAAIEEGSQSSMVQGFQMLEKIKHSLCRPRPILFKVLADTIGLETNLIWGLPCEGTT
ncbi:hypothetical protein V2J09_010892 [Rumex salicifolius]